MSGPAWKIKLGKRAQVTIKLASKEDPRWWYLDQHGVRCVRVTGFEYSHHPLGFVVTFVFFRFLIGFAKCRPIDKPEVTPEVSNG